MPVFALTEELLFPPVELADKCGVLAVGGDLSVERLVLAYRSGIFPWFSDDEPLLWWSPDPRYVLFPEKLKVPKSLEQIINNGRFTVTSNQAFRLVITACREAYRPGQDGTWITAEMLEAYCLLHEAGLAHSVEVWLGEDLVGGLYGVSIGACFSGESMFAEVSNASKVALVFLVRKLMGEGCKLIDCQQETELLGRFGAENISRSEFIKILKESL